MGLARATMSATTVVMCKRRVYALVIAAGCVFAAGLGTGCAATEWHVRKLAWHSFEFEANQNRTGTTVLDFRYGNSRVPGLRGCITDIPCSRPFQGIRVSGKFEVADFLTVKWTQAGSSRVIEKTIDLRAVLPSDMSGHTIRFAIDDEELYVFLVSPERITPNPCPAPDVHRRLLLSTKPTELIFASYCAFEITQVYPPSSHPVH